MTIGRHRGVLLAVLVSVLSIAARELEYSDVAYDRFHLPAFDGHVYVAMAERPGFFTVAPWGYRVLNSWLIRALLPTARDVVPAFFWSTVIGLSLGGVLLFLYLRRLGIAELPSLLGVVLFAVSGPVGASVRYQFLVEPLTFALEMALLLALESAAPLGCLAFIAVLGCLAKESFLLFLPLVYLVRHRREGRTRAIGQTLAVALVALVVTIGLRRYWTPQIRLPLPIFDWQTVLLAAGRVSSSWGEWWTAPLLMGLAPLAIVGACLQRGRALAARGAYLLAATIVTPFLNPVTFVSPDIERLLLYALPGVIPLALGVLGRSAVPTSSAPPRAAAPARRYGTIWALLTAAAMALPLLIVDRYRRMDLQGARDAPVTLAVLRETLHTAEDLDEGREFVFDPAQGRFSRGLEEPFELSQLRRVRWFLRDGWGPLAQKQAADVLMQGREATILLPCLHPQDLDVRLTLDAPAAVRLLATVDGRPVADALVTPDGAEAVAHVPAALLVRGDNLLSLAVSEEAPAPRVRLLALTVRPAGR